MFHVDGLVHPARLAPHGEHHLEVVVLGGAHHVEQLGGPEVTDAVPQGGEIGGGVAVPAVGLAHDERQRFTVAAFEPGREGAQCPVVRDEQTFRLEFGDDVVEHVVVGALPCVVGVGEGHLEAVVGVGEVGGGHLDEDPPQTSALGVTGLEGHDPRPTAIGELGVGVKACPGRLVKGIEVAHRRPLGAHRVAVGQARVDEMFGQHPKRGAPVTEVVLADHVVTEERQRAGQGVPDDCGPQVSDVHLLGHVGRRVVDHHGVGFGGGSHTAAVRCEIGEQSGEGVVAQRQVDEPWPGHLGGEAQVGHVEGGHEVLGHVAWRSTEAFGERQRPVDLGVGVLGGTHHRVVGGAVRVEGRHGRCGPLADERQRVSHVSRATGRPRRQR